MSKIYGVSAALALALAAGAASAQCNNFTITQGTGTVPSASTDVGNHGDDVVTTVALPFGVTMYGNVYNTITVSSNGSLQFATASTAYTNGCLPSATFVGGPTILPHWDDQRTDTAGTGIFTELSGSPGSQTFDVVWRTTYFGSGAPLNYAVRFYEGQAKFTIYHGAGTSGASATVGVQANGAAGSNFDQLHCNGAGAYPVGDGNTFTIECNLTAPAASVAIVGAAGNGATVLATVTAVPAQTPPSTGLSARLDASAAGGSSNLQMYDDGTHGDVNAGDNVFSNLITLGTGYTDQQSLTVIGTVTDAQARTATANGAIVIDDNMPAIATAIDSSEPVTQIVGNLSGAESDMYRIHLCDPANFSATTVGGTTVDTQLFLFKADGTGVTMNDDHVGGTTLQSALSSTYTAALPAGDYYLAVSQFDKDPLDANGAQIWTDLVGGSYRVEHAPDDVGAANPIASWSANVGAAGGAYTVMVNGVSGQSCGGGCPGNACGTSDYNGDGDFGTDQDIEAFFACVGGTCCPTCFCQGSDFNGDGDFGTDQDIEAFFRVLGGNNC